MQINSSKLNLIILRNQLKNASPKDLSVGEVDLIVGKMLPVLSEVLAPDLERYNVAEKAVKALRDKIADKSLTPEEAQVEANKINQPILDWETSEEGGKSKISIDLEDKTLAEFQTLAETHGKDWFNNIENFYSFRKDFSLRG